MNATLAYPKSKLPAALTMRECRHGAPIGQRNTLEAPPDFDGTLHLTLLKMSPCGAYCALSGTYWGSATARTGWMYRAWYYAEVDDEVVHIEMFVRGITRRHARLAVLEKFPKARFYK